MIQGLLKSWQTQAEAASKQKREDGSPLGKARYWLLLKAINTLVLLHYNFHLIFGNAIFYARYLVSL